MKAGAVKSPWGGFDVYVLPDSDDEAYADGWPEEIIAGTTSTRVVHEGSKMYVRRTTWERLCAEFAALGARRPQ